MLISTILLFALTYAAFVDGSIVRQRRCIGTGCATTTTSRVTKVITETTYVEPQTIYVQPVTIYMPPPRRPPPPCHPWCHRRRPWGWRPRPPPPPMDMCFTPPCW